MVMPISCSRARRGPGGFQGAGSQGAEGGCLLVHRRLGPAGMPSGRQCPTACCSTQRRAPALMPAQPAAAPSQLPSPAPLPPAPAPCHRPRPPAHTCSATSRSNSLMVRLLLLLAIRWRMSLGEPKVRQSMSSVATPYTRPALHMVAHLRGRGARGARGSGRQPRTRTGWGWGVEGSHPAAASPRSQAALPEQLGGANA
jgi:hypothetical protein